MHSVSVISSLCSDMTDMSKPCKDQQKNTMALYEVRATEEYQNINTLRSRQNGRHFADDIFKGIFLNENVSIAFKISLKLVPKS